MYREWKTAEERNKHCNGFLSPDGKIKQGLPRITWRDTVQKDVECMNITCQDVCQKATERNGKNGLPDVLVEGMSKVEGTCKNGKQDIALLDQKRVL